MNTYHAFNSKGGKIELTANTSYEAQKKAALLFKAKKAYEISVILVAKDNVPVVHSTSEI